MAVTTDPTTNIGKLRGLLDDPDGSDFDDAALLSYLTSANLGVAPGATPLLDDGAIYFSAYLAYMVLAGKAARNARKQKILSVITKDTYVTYLALRQMAKDYLVLSQRSGYTGSISVTIPYLDQEDLYLVESLDTFTPRQQRVRRGEDEVW